MRDSERKVVPVIPTEEMTRAALAAVKDDGVILKNDTISVIYAAMLDAAPSPNRTNGQSK